MSRLALLPDEPEDEQPSLADAKYAQISDAVTRLGETHADAPTLHYPDLVGATGPMLPGQLWIVLARPANGKTTFLLNLGNQWLGQGRGFAYFGTEEAADAALLRFAAIRTGNDPAAVVAGEWDKVGGGPITGGKIGQAQEEVARELGRLERQPVYFAPETRPALSDLRRVAFEAVDLKLPLMVVDHFHRMAIPETQNQVGTMAETVRRIKQLAVETGLIIVMAAQARRASDALQRFHPPLAESGMGTSALEQEADVVLGLYRPLKAGLDRQQLNAFLAGELDEHEILRPYTMGIRVLKHRRNSDLSGRTVYLHCQWGMLAGLYRLPEIG